MPGEIEALRRILGRSAIQEQVLKTYPSVQPLMGFCSIATILQVFSLNTFWVFGPTSLLCLHISGCGVYLDSWKSGKPEYVLCAWAAYSLPVLLLFPSLHPEDAWDRLHSTGIILALTPCWVTQTIPMSFTAWWSHIAFIFLPVPASDHLYRLLSGHM